mgnify:CR=1 FL=1
MAVSKVESRTVSECSLNNITSMDPLNEEWYENLIIDHMTEKLGYEHLYGPDVRRTDDSYRDVFLPDILPDALRRINRNLPEAAVEEAIRKILSAGWLITNQLVYTVAASRRGHTTRLRQVLNSLGVVCYYTFSVKGFQENYAVFTPNSRSMQEQVEEKVYGRLTPEQAAELDDLLADGTDTAAKIRCFMRRHHLPFLATDRSVLNLPAIGKSMSFRLVGITAEGKRLLRFDHDRTRRHSPIIDSMGEIFIVENKSLAAYLRQLGKMGEDPEDYASIWAYTHGETEPRFGLYVYPDFGFATTDRVSNLELE